MKILLWAPFHRTSLGGGEVLVTNLREGLAEVGVECLVAAMRRGRSTDTGLVDIPIDLRLQKLLYASYGFEIFSPFLARVLKRIVEDERADFVHIEHPVLARTLIDAIGRIPGSRRPDIVFDLGGIELDLSPFRSHLNRFQYSLIRAIHTAWYSCFDRVDYVNVFSHYNHDLVKRLGSIPKKGIISINLNMVNDNWFDSVSRDEKRYSASPLRLYLPGRIERVKGHAVISQALRIVVSKFNRRDFQVYFTGRGRFRNTFLKQVRDYGIRQNFCDLGWMPYSALKSTFEKSAVVLELYQHAGVFSQVLVESMATANCLVVSDLGAFREVVESGKTGLLVPNDDSDALAKTLVSLMDDRETVRKIGLSGNNLARLRFKRSAVIQNLVGFYQDPERYSRGDFSSSDRSEFQTRK